MKKLRHRILLTLLLLLNICMIVFTGLLAYISYTGEREQLSQSLRKFASTTITYSRDSEMLHQIRIIGDYPSCIVMLDGPDRIADRIQDGKFRGFDPEAEALRIGRTVRPGQMYTGNLYFSNIAWYSPSPGMLVIMDTSSLRQAMIRNLLWLLLLLAASEAVSIYLARSLTEHMMKPVEEAFNKQKEFIADASHELKTPLAVIQASAEAMSVDPSPSWTRNILEESTRMSKLITRLLDLTRIEESKAVFETVSLSALVEKTILPYESVLFEKGLLLEDDIEENVQMRCDPTQIEQVVVILLDNAMQHCTPHGTIQVRLAKGREGIKLAVTNPGDPIPAGQEEKIFERFYRADKARSRSQGRYGLGLAIARSIVENHEGTITARSAGGFTTFTVLWKG